MQLFPWNATPEMERFFTLVFFSLLFSGSHEHVDCSLGEASCQSCMVAYPFCYWCENGDGGSCKNFFSAESASRDCPNRWRYKECSGRDISEHGSEKQKLDRMMSMITELQAAKKKQALLSLLGENLIPAPTTPPSKKSTLKELLRKLLLLKLLRKAQNGDEETASLGLEALESESSESSKSSENEYLSKLVGVLEKLEESKSHPVTTASTSRANLVENIPDTVSSLPQYSKGSAMPSKSTHSVKTSNPYEPKPSGGSDRGEEVNLEYVDEETDSLITEKATTKASSGVAHMVPEISTLPPRVLVTGNSSVAPSKKITRTYCELYELEDICNTDNNCTWCNTVDSCIGRNSDDYNTCIQSAKRMTDMDYGLDQCLEYKNCGDCVANEKCYWCETSKSCHAYPFFGYVPHSCSSGNWYYKQCDIQLAVVVVILPLFIVLLAMLTFYFCLKYCYYRKKILRVPLFERPGVFDYRKNKKVYFVNPNDEDEDGELKAEQLRKKYRLPIEREPLIDPNM